MHKITACSSGSWNAVGIKVAQVNLPEDVFVNENGTIYVPDNYSGLQKNLA